MKKVIYILPLILLGLFSACNSSQHTQEKSAFVTIEPLRYITEQIAGEEWTIHTMVPNGSSPETYDPTPNQLVELSNSKAYFSVGYLGFEMQWLSNLQENAPQVKFFNTSNGIELLEGHHHEGEEEEEGVDPHIWTTPKNLLQMARNICTAFCEMDTSNTDAYKQRLMNLEKTIMQTDSAIQKQCQEGVQKTFGIYHPSLTYFAHDYGLEQICIEEGGKEPSPAQMKVLVDRCRQLDIQTILIQSEFNTKNAEIIAQETGAKLVPINPLSYDWNQEMLHIIQALKKP